MKNNMQDSLQNNKGIFWRKTKCTHIKDKNGNKLIDEDKMLTDGKNM